MSATAALHPAVRERQEPRVTAASLAQYLIVKPDTQDTVLHDSRFSQPPISGAYADAWRGLKAYNTDPRRDKQTLHRVKEALEQKAASGAARLSVKQEALRCLEVIELFEANENAMGLRGLPLVAAPRFISLNIEGVAVSVQPDFLIETVGDKPKLGALMLRLAKAPDPASAKMEATKAARGEHRREMARYMVPLMERALREQCAERGEIDRDLIFVADLRLGERIGAGKDFSARVKSIDAGCRQIKRLWDTVTPRKSILRKED